MTRSSANLAAQRAPRRSRSRSSTRLVPQGTMATPQCRARFPKHPRPRQHQNLNPRRIRQESLSPRDSRSRLCYPSIPRRFSRRHTKTLSGRLLFSAPSSTTPHTSS
ncbi:hypothetical protein EXIGLDRAFT_411005 [Exidia glandulosa HHB12029]|uniref:Uncharacterized protein n=1 Tax=Exidia glandulosa HHB12029 TaxID=1314781 RepID=A0A165KNS8_EXIGL|nr:hypothetical protein EXIGLDRAFT_411005 [Exidia glandulosa HHB12029]